MTDNAFAYIHNKTLHELLYRRRIRRPVPGRTRPAPTGRSSATSRPCNASGPTPCNTLSDARREALPHWVCHYNEQRTHSALGNRPPTARVRDVTGHNS
jgi:transposase InsO family protein